MENVKYLTKENISELGLWYVKQDGDAFEFENNQLNVIINNNGLVRCSLRKVVKSNVSGMDAEVLTKQLVFLFETSDFDFINFKQHFMLKYSDAQFEEFTCDTSLDHIRDVARKLYLMGITKIFLNEKSCDDIDKLLENIKRRMFEEVRNCYDFEIKSYNEITIEHVDFIFEVPVIAA